MFYLSQWICKIKLIASNAARPSIDNSHLQNIKVVTIIVFIFGIR